MRKLVLLSGLFCLIQAGFAQISVESREKSTDSWKSYPVEHFSDNAGYEFTPVVPNNYGSNPSHRTTATGFFRTEKIDGRWYIIDPDGYTYIHKGVACVAPGTSVKQKAAVTSRWGSNEAWSVYATNWMKAAGFTGSGAWSSVSLLRTKPEPVVYSVIINPMSTYRTMHRGVVGGYTNAGWQGYEHNIIRVFDPAFETYMENACRPLSQYKDDKYLLGYFVDNELPWVNDALDRHLKFLAPTEPGYIAAKGWLDARKGKDAGLADITQEDRNDFWDFYAGKFFSLAKTYITKYDPNHLFLGSRFNQRTEELANPYIFATAGKYCDIISINHYREWEPITSRMSNWEKWSGKPFMITEFYTKGEDTGLPNVSGAGWLVKTQRDRGLFYQNFIIKLLKSNGCVGWDWFRYQDNDPEDLSTDQSNRDANKGLIDSNYDDHHNAMEIIKATNYRVYSFLEYLQQHKGDEEKTLMPVDDSFVRMMNADHTVYGADQLLRVKNGNGNSYERTTLLRFDFTPLLEVVDRISSIELNIGLSGIYPAAKDPSTVQMNAYAVSNLPFEESEANSVILARFAQREDTYLGNVTIPVSTQSRNQVFAIDITTLKSMLKLNPVITLRLQMNVETETQFEFASRENSNTALRPLLRIQYENLNTASEALRTNSVQAFVRDSNLIITGYGANSQIRLYNMKGELVHSLPASASRQVSLPVCPSWGTVLIVSVDGKKSIKTFI
ncbi:MAG: hypothetical protein PHU68_09460 [Paludibacter sp.]|nr:hypothetical protein [Paludibacter sp.]